MELPKKIILRDRDGGYMLGRLAFQEGDLKEDIPLYEYVEYYHTLDQALEEIKEK